MSSVPRQRSSLEERLDSTGPGYILCTSNYGINEAVSLPTFTVILRDAPLHGVL